MGSIGIRGGSQTSNNIVKVANAAARTSLSAVDGVLVLQLDNDTLYMYDSSSSSWKVISDPYVEAEIIVIERSAFVTTGNSKATFVIGKRAAGRSLKYLEARVDTAGIAFTTDIQIRNVTTGNDMLSTKLTIDAAEVSSSTAATPYVIDAANSTVSEFDYIAIDVDDVSTDTMGLIVRLTFE